MKTTAINREIGTAEAFYRVFCALPKQARLAVARYIFQDAEIRHSLELSDTPNDLTLRTFAEEKAQMPAFSSIDDLRKDLLA